jgi:hypothetical protein
MFWDRSLWCLLCCIQISGKQGRSDDLTKSIHYGEVSHQIKEYVESHTFQLLERIVEGLAEELLLTVPQSFRGKTGDKKALGTGGIAAGDGVCGNSKGGGIRPTLPWAPIWAIKKPHTLIRRWPPWIR